VKLPNMSEHSDCKSLSGAVTLFTILTILMPALQVIRAQINLVVLYGSPGVSSNHRST
jgi:hypothetical protein